MTLETITSALLANPLFHFSLSSKELFHSNFWFWLSMQAPFETAKLFMPGLQKGDVCEFKREQTRGATRKAKAQVDLVIYVNNVKRLVIENKTKDIIQDDQVTRIETNHGRTPGDKKFLLVTLFGCYLNLSNHWNVLRYDELAQRIEKADFRFNAFESEIVQRYAQLLVNLDQLQRNLPVTMNYDFTERGDKRLYTVLNDLKLWESYAKMRGHIFALDYKNSRADNNISTLISVNRKKVTVDFYYPLANDGRIGVQVEDNRFCKFINKAGNKTDFHILMAGENIYFENNYRSPRKQLFNKFKPDFYYQYTTLQPGMPIKEVYARLDEQLRNIKNQWSVIEPLVS